MKRNYNIQDRIMVYGGTRETEGGSYKNGRVEDINENTMIGSDSIRDVIESTNIANKHTEE